MGSGGLGGYYGGLLARAGEDVTFIARGAHLEAIRTNGLSVKSQMVGDFTVPASATDDPSQAGPADLVLLGVKSYDLDSAAEQIKPLLGTETVVVPLQNGVDAADRVASVVGKDPVVVGVAYVSAFIEEPGVIKHNGLNKIALGEPSGGPSTRIEQIAQVIEGAKITCDTPPDIRIPLWEKFILLAGTGGVMALTRLSAGPLRECPEASALFRGAMDEALAVGRASGVPLSDEICNQHWEMMLGMPTTAHGSMLQDLKAGRRLELESLVGELVRQGRELGVPTPLNFTVYAALKAFADGPPTEPT